MSPLDAAFVQLEAPGTPMHVGALMQFQIPDDAPDDFVAGLLHGWRAHRGRPQLPWTSRLVVPRRWQAAPATVESQNLDLEYHLRHQALPYPGGERELGQLIARLHSQPMDLRKPLWECHVIEGLSDRRFALFIKFHHSIVDGISATQLLMRGLQTASDSPLPEPFWCQPTQPNSKNSLAGRAAIRDLPSIGGKLLRLWRKEGEVTSLRDAPHSIFNARIGAQRRFATQSVELDRVKAVARAAGVSVNDVVLSLGGAAIRSYLKDINQLPRRSLTAAIPMSLREPGDRSARNAVSMLYSELGTHIADPLLRLHTISRSTSAAKTQVLELPKSAREAYSMLNMAPFVGSILSGRAGRHRPLFNVVVSNVPGSPEPRYLNGARLLHCYPANIVMHGMALSITCYSHAGYLNFGITACRDSVPHMQRLATALADALLELESALQISNGGEAA